MFGLIIILHMFGLIIILQGCRLRRDRVGSKASQIVDYPSKKRKKAHWKEQCVCSNVKMSLLPFILEIKRAAPTALKAIHKMSKMVSQDCPSPACIGSNSYREEKPESYCQMITGHGHLTQTHTRDGNLFRWTNLLVENVESKKKQLNIISLMFDFKDLGHARLTKYGFL